MLPGDVNDDGVVNSKDFAVLRKEWSGKGTAQSLIFGDLLGDGAVTKSDWLAAEKFRGTKLPKLGGRHPKVILARPLVQRDLGMKRR